MSTLHFENIAQRRRFTDFDASDTLKWYFSTAVFWLLAGSILAIMASIKLHAPNFLGESPWLTFGRVRPLHLNTMVYGWASLAATGVGLWILTRTLRHQLVFKKLLKVGIISWNFGLLLGSYQLLAGHTNGLEWLEFPFSSAAFILFGLYTATISAISMLLNRKVDELYISVLYITAGFLWICVLLLVAHLPRYSPTVEAGMNWWYAHNALGLWFTPISLAAAYFFIPKVTGRPVYSYWLSLLGFWSLAIFYNWNGFHHLIGGPVPTWATTVSIAASVMMVIPVVTVAVNHHMTIIGSFRAIVNSPTLRFVVFGAMSYTFVSLQGSMQALRSVNETVHFTHYVIAHAHIGMYSFVTMVMFGSIYYIVPRITQRDWLTPGLIKAHFWLTALGVLLYIAALQWGGVKQGLMMNDADIPFMDIVRYMIPFLQARSVAALMMTAGHVIFAWVLFKHFKESPKLKMPEAKAETQEEVVA